MPNITPSGVKVDWPIEEGVLGVLGVAPWATIAFCREFYSLVRATKDWHYPRVILDINPKIPSRGRHLQLGEKDPSPYIAESIKELHQQGATLAVVPCNTAHILFEKWAKLAPIPVLNIINETVDAAKSCGAKRIAALVSSSLAEFDLYGKAIRGQGLSNALLDKNDNDFVSSLIEDIKIDSKFNTVSLKKVEILCTTFIDRKIDTVILGCTELSALAVVFKQKGIAVIDSNIALAKASLKKLLIVSLVIRLVFV